MSKLSIMDFCRAEKTYSQLIQNLFLHISVKKLYEVLMMYSAEKGDVHQSVSYRSTYEMLEKNIPAAGQMTVGELLRYATEDCLGAERMESPGDRQRIRLGHRIVTALLVELFDPIAEMNHCSYESVLMKMKKAADAAG